VLNQTLLNQTLDGFNLKADRISDYKDKFGYLYEDDYDSLEGFNKNVFYSDELAGQIDL